MINTFELVETKEIIELIEKTRNIDENNHSTHNLSLWVQNSAFIYYRLILLARFNDKITFVKTIIDYNNNNIIDDIDITNVNINSIYNDFKETEADEIETNKIIKTLVKYRC